MLATPQDLSRLRERLKINEENERIKANRERDKIDPPLVTTKELMTPNVPVNVWDHKCHDIRVIR